MSKMELPKDTEELWFEGEPSYHLLTLQRDLDGNIYLVAWAYGAATVLAVARPYEAKRSELLTVMKGLREIIDAAAPEYSESPFAAHADILLSEVKPAQELSR
jgi:hypothetical protein